MKQTKLTTLFSLAAVCVGMGMASATRAVYTNYLDGLQTEVTARLETNDDPTQTKALNAANKALARNSKSLSQDLGIFSSAITTLNKAFPDDSALDSLEQSAFNNFLNEAGAQFDAVTAQTNLFTTVPTSLQNALNKAYNAYTNASDNTNWAARIRALNLALVKNKVAQLQLNRSLKAPASLDDKTVNVDLHSNGHEHFTLATDGTYTRESEAGAWSYTRTGANTGTITLTPDGGGGATHVLNVTFKSAKTGTFTVEGEDGVTGKITVK
jgi:hypothetical protein